MKSCKVITLLQKTGYLQNWTWYTTLGKFVDVV